MSMIAPSLDDIISELLLLSLASINSSIMFNPSLPSREYLLVGLNSANFESLTVTLIGMSGVDRRS